jgi:predicted RNA-binding Zn-ribbon protein involved in translation (DUF1610 family)
MRFIRRRRETEVIVDAGYPASQAKRVGEAPYDRDTCPSCEARLDPLPKAKKNCPTCGQPIYVRSGPSGMRYLLRESDLNAHEARWDSYNDARFAADALGPNGEAARTTAESIRQYKVLGVLRVLVYRSDDACPACAGVPPECTIDNAPPIPVPGCTNEICRCVISPSID